MLPLNSVVLIKVILTLKLREFSKTPTFCAMEGYFL